MIYQIGPLAGRREPNVVHVECLKRYAEKMDYDDVKTSEIPSISDFRAVVRPTDPIPNVDRLPGETGKALKIQQVLQVLKTKVSRRSPLDFMRIFQKNDDGRHFSCHVPESDPRIWILCKIFRKNYALLHFRGTACRTWRSSVKVETFWTIATDTVFLKNQFP